MLHLETRTYREIGVIASIILLAVSALSSCGEEQEPGPDWVSTDHGHDCITCHTDMDLLLADLEADPLPEEPAESEESEGEG